MRIGGALLIRGDCLAVLPHLAGKYDAIVSDPPYGIAYNPSSPTGSKWKSVKRIVGDSEPFDPQPLLGHVRTICLFGANNFANRLPNSRRWFVWDKRPGMKSMTYSDCELAWCSTDGPARMIRVVWSGANRGEERGQHWHPTQKPIEVMRQIIETVSKPGDTILDPYMGSGTTGIAALRAGRKFIGVEIERRWYEAAETRVQREIGPNWR
ncbi:MAG: site-specific DNA-methyltransferase [Alphaproteobacteria bacterium]|nr:site-specific DNA-methyltransferase [Alphaproteobacteria bacterium]